MSDANDVFSDMLTAIDDFHCERRADDPASPQQGLTLEALPGQTFDMGALDRNVVTVRDIDLRWAAANALHFFARTERAGPLLKYNKHAEKFLTKYEHGWMWHGAYGAIAMPQVRSCVELLRQHRQSRRAVVSMGGLSHSRNDVNSPACWSFIHFLVQGDCLHTMVYQRSLNLWSVMPYDCVVLTNLARHVCLELGLDFGKAILSWTVGSLHVVAMRGFASDHGPVMHNSVYKPTGSLLLSNYDPDWCYQELVNPATMEVLHGEIAS